MRNGNAKTNLSRTSAASRKRERREELRAKGYTLKQFWVHSSIARHVVQMIRKQLRTKVAK